MPNSFFQAATGGASGVRYVIEATPGTTPSVTAANIFQLRNGGCTLGITRDSMQSKELRDDRMPADVKLSNIKVGGNLNCEFSFKEYDPFFEAAMFGAWDTNVLKCGKAVKSFTVERVFSDLAVPQYYQFTGIRVDTMDISLKPGEICTLDFGLVGYTGTMSNASLLTTGSPTASQTFPLYDCYSGAIKEGGSTIAVVTGINLNLKNSITPAFILGQKVAGALPAGTSDVSGSLTCMFTDVTMLNKFLNETESSLEFTLGDGTTASYTWLLPRIKYTSGNPEVTGPGQISLTMNYTAMYSAAESTVMKLTRTAT